MTDSMELLERLYAAAAAGPWAESQLATDTLIYISHLEHALTRESGGPVAFERLVLILGMALGSLKAPANFTQLVSAMRSDTLNPAYIKLLRDQLTETLREAGQENAQ